MLSPQTNRCRTVIDLCGVWEIKIDAENIGGKEEWHHGFEADARIGVPASWNEQLAELGLMNYIGKIWYQYRFHLPSILAHSENYLYFGSVDFCARVWVNGQFVGEHSGGYLPFEFNVTEFVRTDLENLLVVCVDNTLTHHTIPQGIQEEDYVDFEKQREQTYPSTAFDFFAYGGINRPVSLVSLSSSHFTEIDITTRIKKNTGYIEYEITCNQIPKKGELAISLDFHHDCLSKKAIAVRTNTVHGTFEIPDCKFWSPRTPDLYQLCFILYRGSERVDEYRLQVGIREIEVKNSKLLLNGKPIFLKGFGKHEDFPVLGKGLSIPLLIKDFQLMKWIGANSFRTSHYPYAEEIIQLADELGFLVIDEVPAVSLNFKYVTTETLKNHKKAITELIKRDKNHASVICWSLANEPGIWGETEAVSEKAERYWQEIRTHAVQLDPTRPITLPASSKWGSKDLCFRFSDILSVNRYWGWYEVPGQIRRAGEIMKEELEKLYEIYHKPVFVSEFGADAIEGEHETYPQLFTEEYQLQLLLKYFEVIESLPFTVGEHIWNFADFRTAQHHRRLILNRKGVFNRQRQPKAAAFAIRKHWNREILCKE